MASKKEVHASSAGEAIVNFFKDFKNYFTDFGKAISNGDAAVKLSTVLMGAGYFARKRIVVGILTTIYEALFVLMCIFYATPNLAKFGTLGTTVRSTSFDPVTMQNTVIPGDNSFLILLNSVIALFMILVFILTWIHNIKRQYELQLMSENGEHINSFAEDVKSLVNGRFNITLMALPTIGVILMNVIPILILIAIAFTNYDQQHMPPSSLFTWVGLTNFKSIINFSSTNSAFGYAFFKVLGWTLVWAFFSTFTCFLGGIVMAKLISYHRVKFPKFWRTLFVITIAVPQFVTLLLVRYFFGDSGIVNSFCSSIGITSALKAIGLVSAHLNYIPFLTNPSWAKFMIIMINIWVGVPYQMLIATGVLLNIPESQIESAKLDGANAWQIFWHITMPYVLFVEGPTLITDFVRNINNFNVIYLLTQDTFVTTNQTLANANAKEVDLLVTWLFRLTNDYYNYKMASVIGIIVFVICAVFSLIAFSKFLSGGREESYQ
ncbi:MAG: sugar ABC transporter permease [Clostridiales bacterium]|nr:sugar ABC transporter permease [Clostridiales bacterium]